VRDLNGSHTPGSVGDGDRGHPEDRDDNTVKRREEIKREVNRILIHECRCDERLRGKPEGSTRLTYTGLPVGLEHLKIETSL
jgi:hypothetical protein